MAVPVWLLVPKDARYEGQLWTFTTMHVGMAPKASMQPHSLRNLQNQSAAFKSSRSTAKRNQRGQNQRHSCWPDLCAAQYQCPPGKSSTGVTAGWQPGSARSMADGQAAHLVNVPEHIRATAEVVPCCKVQHT